MWKTEIVKNSNLEKFLNENKIIDFKVVEVSHEIILQSHLGYSRETSFLIAYKTNK